MLIDFYQVHLRNIAMVKNPQTDSFECRLSFGNYNVRREVSSLSALKGLSKESTLSVAFEKGGHA